MKKLGGLLMLISGISLFSLIYSDTKEHKKTIQLTASDIDDVIKPETNHYKYVPKGAPSKKIIQMTAYGLINLIWYNKNCKTPEECDKEFNKREGNLYLDELFVDINGDNIADISLEGFLAWENRFRESREIQRNYTEEVNKLAL